jgi:hypothetical protein
VNLPVVLMQEMRDECPLSTELPEQRLTAEIVAMDEVE